MNYVLDACAMIALLRDEPGADRVAAVLLQSGVTNFVHAINLTEVHYDFIRAADESIAADAIKAMRSTGIKLRKDISDSFLCDVAKLKGNIRRISLADCFCVTLARRLDATILTSDRGEFEPLKTKNICMIEFIR